MNPKSYKAVKKTGSKIFYFSYRGGEINAGPIRAESKEVAFNMLQAGTVHMFVDRERLEPEGWELVQEDEE